MNSLHISPEARNDLLQIRQYIGEELANKTAADALIKKVMKRIRSLSENAMLGASLSAKVGFATHYRYLVCENYLIFYYAEAQDVYIIRVLYGRRDYIRILFGETL